MQLANRVKRDAGHRTHDSLQWEQTAEGRGASNGTPNLAWHRIGLKTEARSQKTTKLH